MLDLCERYSINPQHWNAIDHDKRVLMRAKWELDRDYRDRQAKQQTQGG
ncbi:hypothetical protein PP657_gp076 [Bacillus phage BCPST]|uniref:Uncharacterized protein n=2 Tax=Yihwangvirus TaxID=3044863 RepID=A0AAE7PD51_9CAUD|nr:hypothetical protein PP656_gp093 [Bacillus phage pW4]YP_010657329.1 hypothetical protein PP657_gp076 [Bacillus phage BCPST]AZU99061.1 hypothetical protein pW4_40 [Bacillus phage pW4]QQO38694.1 hypothetical protein BCPST_076 [Bacillus phage BCPST]